jgi:tetratricopeptide (TPR) repeat protein
MRHGWIAMVVGAGLVWAQGSTPAAAQQSQSLGLCVQFYSAKRYDTAKGLCERAVREQPTNGDALLWLARTQLKLGQVTAAIENLRLSIRQNAANVSAYIALAQAHIDQYRLSENRDSPTARASLDQALNTLREAERVRPNYAATFLNRGVVLALQGQYDSAQYDRAVEALKKAQSLEDNAISRSTLADVYLAQGKPEEALKTYADAVLKFPRDLDLRTRYGSLLLVSNRCAEAVENFTQASILAPGDAEVYVLTGQAQFCLKNWKLSGVAFENAVALAPARYPDAYFSLGRVYVEIGDWAKARFNFTKAVALTPKSADYRYWLGRSWESTGDKAAARNNYEEALKLRPDFPEAREALARVR